MKLLQFKAEWCGPCRGQTKEFEENPVKVELETIDIAEDGQAVEKYKVRSIPTIILVDNDTELKRWNGFTKSKDISAYIKSL